MKPFGYYKKGIDSILENTYSNKQLFKENFHVVTGAMKLSKEFREFFTLYNEIESSPNVEKYSEQYLNETIDYLRPKVENIKKVCKVLDRVFETRESIIERKENIFYDNLDYLIFKTGSKSLTKRIESKNTLVESIKNRKVISKLGTKVSPNILAYTLSENFNKEYSSLSDTEKKLVSEVVSINPNKIVEEVKTEKKSLLSKLNHLIEENKENSIIEKLVETKNRVLGSNNDKLSLIQLKQLSEDLNS